MNFLYRDGELVKLEDYEVEKFEVSPDMVKSEASRRILAFLPFWQQNNLTARMAELVIKGRENWTTEEIKEWENIQQIWERVKFIRSRSNAIEALVPIPEDYRNEAYWI